MLVEVALEVEVRQLLALGDAQKLLERGIRLDVVLVLQALLLDVVIDGLGDLRAAHQEALGLAKERAQLLRDLRGALEDGRGTLDLNAVLVSLDTALALASILDLAMHALLELLDLRHKSSRRLAERAEVRRNRLEVLIERSGGASGNGRRGLRNRRADRCNYLGYRRYRDDSLGLRGLLGRDRLDRRNRRGGGHRDRNLRNNLLLRNRLLRDLSTNRSVHHTGTRGILTGHFTHYLQ